MVRILERTEIMGDAPTRRNGCGKTLRVKSGPCNVVLRSVWNALLGSCVQPATMIGFKQIEFFDHTGWCGRPHDPALLPSFPRSNLRSQRSSRPRDTRTPSGHSAGGGVLGWNRQTSYVACSRQRLLKLSAAEAARRKPYCPGLFPLLRRMLYRSRRFLFRSLALTLVLIHSPLDVVVNVVAIKVLVEIVRVWSKNS